MVPEPGQAKTDKKGVNPPPRPAHSHVEWAGSSWRLRVDAYSRPDGSLIEKGIVEHPGSVVLVPMMEGQVFMLHQYRPALDETILELPAGTRDGEEDWEQCAQRELREETGFRAAEFTSLGQIWPAPGLSSEVMAIFLATGLSLDPLPADFDEHLSVTPWPFAELVSMALDGRLQDAKSIVALLRTQVYLGRQKP